MDIEGMIESGAISEEIGSKILSLQKDATITIEQRAIVIRVPTKNDLGVYEKEENRPPPNSASLKDLTSVEFKKLTSTPSVGDEEE